MTNRANAEYRKCPALLSPARAGRCAGGALRAREKPPRPSRRDYGITQDPAARTFWDEHVHVLHCTHSHRARHADTSPVQNGCHARRCHYHHACKTSPSPHASSPRAATIRLQQIAPGRAARVPIASRHPLTGLGSRRWTRGQFLKSALPERRAHHTQRHEATIAPQGEPECVGLCTSRLRRKSLV